MKTLRIAAALLVTFVLATAAAPASAAPRRSTAHLAADKSVRVHSIQQSLIEEGYKLSSVQEQPIYYFVAPKAPYIWGSLVYTYTRTSDEGSETVELTVQVQYATDGYNFPEITIREQAQ